jgi:hypothetical protein
MKKVTTVSSTLRRTKEGLPMMEWPPKDSSVTIRPMTDEEADRIDKVLKASRALGEKILARRNGKPLPSSWKLIRKAREERSKRIL